MFALVKTPWIKLSTFVLAALLSIGALTIPSAPAKARVFIGFGVGAPVGWGYVPSPYYGYYGYPYYPAYYGHPGFFVGGAFGAHRHWHHYRHW